jgi:hypothetical protein
MRSPGRHMHCELTHTEHPNVVARVRIRDRRSALAGWSLSAGSCSLSAGWSERHHPADSRAKTREDARREACDLACPSTHRDSTPIHLKDDWVAARGPGARAAHPSASRVADLSGRLASRVPVSERESPVSNVKNPHNRLSRTRSSSYDVCVRRTSSAEGRALE